MLTESDPGQWYDIEHIAAGAASASADLRKESAGLGPLCHPLSLSITDARKIAQRLQRDLFFNAPLF